LKTIEDLKVDKTFYKREKDIFGNVVRQPYQKMMPRAVNVVTPGTRFLYHLIDATIFYFANNIITSVILNTIGVSIFMRNDQSMLMLYSIAMILYGFASYFLYYVISEGFFGTTIGKAIFGYTVIDSYARKPSQGSVALRSIIRYVPFEAFSCFGERGWHDKWSKTYVVKKKEKIELQKLLGTVHDNTDLLD